MCESNSGLLDKLCEQGLDGAATVVEGEAVGGGKLGHGAVEGGNEEERVVAEAAGASGSGEDEAFDRAFGGVKDLAVTGEGEGAAVTGVAKGFGDASESGEESGVVAEVWGVGGVGVGGVCAWSVAKRALRTPGAPSSAATSRPESSARTRRLGARRE